jgi:hypothetical protein
MPENEETDEVEAGRGGTDDDPDALHPEPLDPEPLAADAEDLGELLTREHEPNEVRYGAPPPG